MPASIRPASFSEHQYRFTAYIRDPENEPVPTDIERRRIDLYRELMFNNVENFLSNSFPVLRRISSEQAWREMTQDFFSRHRSKTPYFSEIPEEFLEYLQKERGQRKEDFPFLLELAHYEWVELALALAPDPQEVYDRGTPRIEALNCAFRVSELAWPLVYRYPVHKISKRFKPTQAPEQATYLVVYRDPRDEVKFMEINAASYRFLQIIDQNIDQPAEKCLIELSNELRGEPRSILKYGQELIQNFWLRGIIERAG